MRVIDGVALDDGIEPYPDDYDFTDDLAWQDEHDEDEFDASQVQLSDRIEGVICAFCKKLTKWEPCEWCQRFNEDDD